MATLSLRTVVPCFLLLAAAHPACRPAAPGARTRADFLISIAAGGGFTGLVRGFSLHADGTVEAWQRLPAQPDSILWTIRADPGQVAELARQLEETGALEETYEETGHMTTRVVYSRPRAAHSWSWSSGGGTPAELKEWYGRVRRFCRDLPGAPQPPPREGSP